MSDYDCTNCEWIINQVGDIKCMNRSNMITSETTTEDASNSEIGITNKCDPRCYKFNDSYLKNDYYDNVYNKILTGLSDVDDSELNRIRTSIDDSDIYQININKYSPESLDKIEAGIIDTDTTQESNCTNDQLIARVDNYIDENYIDEQSVINLTLPDVDRDQLKYILNQTNKDIGVIDIDNTYDIGNVYNNLLPNESNAAANAWPCKDSDGTDITDSIETTEFTSDYTNICNANKNFISGSEVNEIIELECDTNGERYKINKVACDNLNGLSDDNLKNLLRESTLNAITGFKPKYIKSDKANYIAEEEVFNYLRHSDTDSDANLPDIPPGAMNNLNTPTSDEYKSLSDILSDNYRFRNCIDEILFTGDSDGAMINRIKTTNLKDYTDDDFGYIDRKLERLISIRPYDLEACFSLINNVDDYICQGVISTSVFNIVNMIVSLFGIKTDIYKLSEAENPDEYNNFKRLLDIIIPKIPIFIKRLLDLARYFETNKCGGKITSTTLILDKINNDIISKKIDVNYNLFDNYEITGFFDDFTKNIYGKIVLLIFISFLISKIL